MAKAIIVEGVRHARTLVLAHTAAVTSGDVVESSGNLLVAVSNVDADVGSAFVYRGRISFPKGAGAMASGATVYWDESAGQATLTSTDNTKCGIAVEAVASADSEVVVSLHEN